MTITQYLQQLVDELSEGDVPYPLAQSFTLATTFADLCRLAGEPVPPDVAAVLDEPALDNVWTNLLRR